MDAVVKQLMDIEKTAKAIVEHAEDQKFSVGQELQAERDKFDQELEADIRKEIAAIRQKAEADMNTILKDQRLANQKTIEALKADFETHHEQYAQEIVDRITEV